VSGLVPQELKGVDCPRLSEDMNVRIMKARHQLKLVRGSHQLQGLTQRAELELGGSHVVVARELIHALVVAGTRFT